MKVYRKLIRPVHCYPGQGYEPKTELVEKEEKWYPEEEREHLEKKYGYLNEGHFSDLIFEEKYEPCLLKEQEAKCLAKAELDDLNENQFVWIEGRTGYLYCLQIIGICRGRTGVSDIQFNAPTSYVERSTNRYGKSYRIWTDKPTEEQSQAVKWE